MDNALAREYFRLVRRSLYRYRSHCQYDDLEGHVLLRVFDYLGRLPEERLPTAAPLVVYWARLAAKEWMVSPECDTRPHTRDGAPLPARVSLADAPAWLAVAPDFAPALVERLWREWAWSTVVPTLSDEEEEVLVLHFQESRSCQEIAGRLRWSKSKVWFRLQEALNRCRRALGEEERVFLTRHRRGAVPRSTAGRARTAKEGEVSPKTGKVTPNAETARERALKR